MAYDFAVRYERRPVRFVSQDEQAGLFAKDGLLLKKLTIVSEMPSGVPQVVDEDGESFALQRISRPCSCVGGVWRMRPSELASAL